MTDGIITVDIFGRKTGGSYDPIRKWNDPDSIKMGEAAENHLNFTAAPFGADATQPNSDPDIGVMINHIPLRDTNGLLVSTDMIVNGISNVAAHEIGHLLGLVPNGVSNQNRVSNYDSRFGDLTVTPNYFDGDSANHTSDSTKYIMATDFANSLVTGTPDILTGNLQFRDQEGSYLKIVLP